VANVSHVRIHDRFIRCICADSVVDVLLSDCVFFQERLVSVPGDLSQFEIGLRRAQSAARLRQLLIDIAGIVGRRARPLRLPRRAVYPFAFGAEMLARVTGRAPFATVDGLRMARYTMHFDDKKARSELGYTSRPYRDGLAEAIEWFIAASP
jgi:nucleoside-diphosphate-sugar epimerase